MTIRLRTAFFIALGVIITWFLYIERAILAPFILAAIFAYLLNPVVNLFTNKVKFPRTLSILIIYALIMFIVIAGGISLSKRAVEESSEIAQYAAVLNKEAKLQINNFPDWIRPTVNDALYSLEHYKIISSQPTLSFLPKVFSRLLSLIVFLFSAFYFLKEGKNMRDKFLNFIPNEFKFDTEIILRKINSTLGSYLRGQIFLVLLVAAVLFIALSMLGVRFALILAIFSGLAEIVPIIGPIVAASIAAIVAFVGGTSNIGLSPLYMAIAVVVVYTIVRQIQDYLVNPLIMGKITKLHPLIILFAVLAGEHTAGILGLILAVPIAGILKILLEFSLDKINDKTAEE
ncbi:MAG: AI-2E family transporter [Patescibacteria group bacterium]|nr:AI-2E family transporter [Patescibacteria group bacterium]